MCARMTRPAAVLIALMLAGCSSPPPTGTSDPPAKLQLERILEFYRSYQDEKRQPPPDEKALKEFIRGLPADRKQGFGMLEDLDALFTSPRDGQKYVVRYKVRVNPGGESEAIAWEATGKDGQRFVALTMGYVEEYDEAGFGEIKRK